MCKRSWTIKPILPDSLICDICKLILQVIMTVLFLQVRFYHIKVSDLRVEVLSKAPLSRLIKVNSGCPKNSERSSTNQWNLHQDQAATAADSRGPIDWCI